MNFFSNLVPLKKPFFFFFFQANIARFIHLIISKAILSSLHFIWLNMHMTANFFLYFVKSSERCKLYSNNYQGWSLIWHISWIHDFTKKIHLPAFTNPFTQSTKCGNFKIFLPLRFYVKSILRILEMQNL